MKGALERLAIEDERTVSDYVRLVLKQHLKSMECFEELVDEHGLMPEQAFIADARKNIPGSIDGDEKVTRIYPDVELPKVIIDE